MRSSPERIMGRSTHLRPRPGLRLRTVIAALALLVPAGPALGAAPLEERLAKALAIPHVSSVRTGALALDLRSGQTVFALNPQRGLLPASTEKLAVAYATLHELGADYRIETDVLGEGELDGTTWRGNLVLKGFGDPTLSTVDLRALARGVRGFGIRSVTGGVVGDESYFDAQRSVTGWKPSYLIYESPPLSALIVDRGKVGRATARNPALTAAALFKAELTAAGVVVAGRSRVGATTAADFPLAFVHSPALGSIVRYMGVESDNFTAEMLLKQLGAYQTGVGTSARGAAVVTATLRLLGVPLGGVRVVDGSGLSWLNRLTASSLVSLLRLAWADPAVGPAFVRTLPVAGVSGTLRKRLVTAPTRGRVFAKTGTTSGASTLAGYVTGRYAFAILHNGRPVSTTWARRAQDRFVLVLARAE
jgi:D-alanyl-D-alanine carboxypeptidase/D-alanyl-D-alanine-endopeptidase (penicillin-binding protein 4)